MPTAVLSAEVARQNGARFGLGGSSPLAAHVTVTVSVNVVVVVLAALVCGQSSRTDVLLAGDCRTPIPICLSGCYMAFVFLG